MLRREASPGGRGCHRAPAAALSCGLVCEAASGQSRGPNLKGRGRGEGSREGWIDVSRPVDDVRRSRIRGPGGSARAGTPVFVCMEAFGTYKEAS